MSGGDRVRSGVGGVRGAAGRGGGRPGRRPGDSGARDDILEAARAEFAELGYERATIRSIASAAEVDPALVLHYFGSKERLFSDALQMPVEPVEVLRLAMEGSIDDVGATMVRSFLDAWEPVESRGPLIARVRSAMTNDTAMALVREYLGRRVFSPVTEALGTPDAELRATLMGSQFIGLVMMRYIARIEPVASASVDELVAAIGPTMQRYLTGDLVPEPSVASRAPGRQP